MKGRGAYFNGVRIPDPRGEVVAEFRAVLSRKLPSALGS